jgi:hypothetical protein
MKPHNGEMTRRTRRRAIVALGVSSMLALSACGAPAYRYVRNTEARTAFKVPTEWAVFDETQVQGGGDGQASTPDPVQWLVGLDADPQPATDHVLSAQDDLATAYPQGIAAVISLNARQRDEVSMGTLRNLVIPIDSIQDQVGTEAVTLLAYDDRIVKDGFRGMHMEVQVAASALTALNAGATGAGSGSDPSFLSGEYIHMSQTAYYDPGTDKVYFLAVLCEAECYNRNRGDIETVIESWAVIP